MATATKPRATVAPIFRRQAQVQIEKENVQCAHLRDAFNKAGAATFVSTSMCVVTRGEIHALDEIVYDNGVAHYRLTPLFWAYLRHAFDNATRACEAGKLDGSTYSELLDRISCVYNLALAQFGEDAVKDAERTFTSAKWRRHCERLVQGAKPIENEYEPDTPSASTGAYRYPADATGAYHPVSKTALALVDAIRDQALAAGWTLTQLYRNVGIAHRDWGLVCYIGSEDRIGTITRQSIEIVHRSTAGTRSLHFYNHEVEQPWLHLPRDGNGQNDTRPIKEGGETHEI